MIQATQLAHGRAALPRRLAAFSQSSAKAAQQRRRTHVL